MKYYARRAYYLDLLSQRRHVDKETLQELAFLEFAFSKHSNRRVNRVLDVACGGGRHLVALAQKGYEGAGIDFTPERVKMAGDRAARANVSIELSRGDAAKLRYEDEFDAVLALNVLFLLPSDEDTAKCLGGTYKALRPGGILICNIYNPFAKSGTEIRKLIDSDHTINESRGQGIRITRIEKLKGYDPVLGLGWIHSTDIIEAPDGRHVFRDSERFRFFTYWDITHFLNHAGFKRISTYPDWKTRPAKRPQAEQLVFVACK